MDKPTLDKLIDDLASDLKDAVTKIESGIKTTQNNYGRYMSLLSTLAKNKSQAQLVGMALIKAGANRQGVSSALQCMGYL
jgi:hypothetical protein